MEPQSQQIKALIELHLGLERLGPGDTAFTKRILSIYLLKAA